MLSREETIVQEPLLKQDGLLGSGLYYEYRTDDARLTLSILKKAVELGALALNYCEVTGFAYSQDNIAGVRFQDKMTGDELQVAAKVVVNATGPWMDQVLSMQHEAPVEKKLLLSKGVHIVVPKSKIPVSQSMYFDIPVDGRMIFCIPRDTSVYIGTTDTFYEGQLDDPAVTEAEIQYLLEGLNNVLEDVRVMRDDVTGSWAGLRPLIYEDGKSPTELSRRDEIFVSPPGLISIAGGKLTGYRKMAERIVDQALKSPHLQETNVAECVTENIRVSGSNYDSDHEMQLSMNQLIREFQFIEQEQIKKLFDRYGDEAQDILSQAATLGSMPPEVAVTYTEVSFAVTREMTHHLADFLYRRTSELLFDPPHIQKHLETIALAMAGELNWDNLQLSAERAALDLH
jgi:glycerol-3-phosphate dehydrogenase